jgi:hypothetical protein
MKGLKKPSLLYKVETLNHIIIYNLMFSLVRSCYICNLLLHDEQCIDGSVASQLELYLQQTLPLLCLEPYKHSKATKLNLNTTKEESNGNKLPSPSLLEHHHKRRQRCIATLSFSSSS